MRIIAGQYKGRRLKTLDGLQVRPTSDRLRETVFNILAPRIVEARVLDLCAGSGAMGIEALSRGAAFVTFIEQNRRAHQTISDNLKHCGIIDSVRVINRDALTALKYLGEHGAQFDLMYFDPPYDAEVYSPVLWLIAKSRLLAADGWLLVEHRRSSPLPESYGALSRFRELPQGETQLSFYRCNTEEGN
ncbi:MAG: 16S rRNA (guanine(966)-N(2))-methyltransferase RsmD [Acidobacteria bacterium]|nr:16S rRNA (guanine(966)-N(2))-methyltransferase RsmD [Acidobacteriota bacterium]